MTTTLLKQLVRLTPIAATIALVLAGSKPAQAGCFMDLAACYGRAAGADSYWQSVLMSADCELDFTDCVRRALIGR
jgi:hypothetical protein